MFTKKLSSTSAYSIDNNKKCSLSTKSSEGPCDTQNLSNAEKSQENV